VLQDATAEPKDRCAISKPEPAALDAPLSEILPAARVAHFVRMTNIDQFFC
jgi:hypothetical protein